jgi:hypothetical protein
MLALTSDVSRVLLVTALYCKVRGGDGCCNVAKHGISLIRGNHRGSLMRDPFFQRPTSSFHARAKEETIDVDQIIRRFIESKTATRSTFGDHVFKTLKEFKKAILPKSCI